MSDYGSFDEDELFRVLEEVESRSTKSKTRVCSTKNTNSETRKSGWLPKEQWIKQQSWYKPRSSRSSRVKKIYNGSVVDGTTGTSSGSKRKRGERKSRYTDGGGYAWNSDLSEEENVQRSRKHRLLLRRRRAKASPPPEAYWTRAHADEAERRPRIKGQKRERVRLKPFEYKPGEGNLSEERQLAYRRASRETTPEWLSVGPEDRHKYRKMRLIDDQYVALAEDTRNEYLSDMTLVDGPSSEGEGDLVDMGKLFSFLGGSNRPLSNGALRRKR